MNKQYNEITNEYYQGLNQSRLQVSKKKNNFSSDAWLTFLQARDLKLKIKKDSKGISITKHFIEEEEIENGKTRTISIPTGHSTIFNLDQTEKFNKK